MLLRNLLIGLLCSLSVLGATYRVQDVVKMSELTPQDVVNAFDNGLERTPEGYRVCWTGKTHHGEFFLRKHVLLKECTAMRFKVQLSIPEESPLTSVTLRLQDRNSEVFQLTCAVQGTGLQTLSYAFDPAKAKALNRWPRNPGAKIDGVMDFPLFIAGVSFSYRAKGQEKGDVAPGWFELRQIAYETDGEHEDFMDRLLVELDTGSPLHLLSPEDNRQPVLRFRNPRTAGCRCTVVLSEDGYDGAAPRKFTRTLAVPAQGEATWPLPRAERLGVWRLRMELTNVQDAADKAIRELSYAIMRPTGLAKDWSQDDFKFTVCSHPSWFNSPERWEMEALAMETMGARYLRHGCSMARLQKDGTLDTTQFDAITDTYARHGVERTCCIGYTTKWTAADQEAAAKTKSYHGLAPRTDYWRSFVRQLFQREKGRIQYWELWNEADLPGFCLFDAATYAELAKIAREELDAAGAGKLMSSGYAVLPNHFKPGFQEDSLRLAGKCFDIHCYHGHGIFERYVSMIDEHLLPLRRKLNLTIPWYAHETALTSAGHGEDKQADTLYQKLIFSWARGSIGYTWYNLVNKGDDPHNSEHNYGMLTSTFHPKAVYVAFNTMTTLFGGKGTRFVRQHETPEGLWLFELTDGRDTLLAFWNEEERDADLTMAANSTTAEQIDLMGNRRPLPLTDGVARLTAGRRPVTLRFAGLNAVKTAQVKAAPGSNLAKLPIGRQFGEQPLFVLDKRAQVYSRFEAMPEHVDKVWKSADDLSLKAWVAVADGTFRLKVVVTDDVHRQKNHGETIWQGDSVQFFLNFPGQRTPWELGMALHEDGTVSTYCWNSPLPMKREQAGAQLQARIRREGTVTTYEAELPLAALDVTEKKLSAGFRFCVQANDDDTGQREGWISLVPASRDRLNVRRYPWLVLP